MLSTFSVVANREGKTHSEIQVVEGDGTRYLRFGRFGGWQGALDLRRPDLPVFPYQRAFASLLKNVPAPQRFMALGVGTGTSLRSVKRTFPNCALYGVEIDQVVIDIAIQYFECPTQVETNYWVGDGVTFLCNVDLKFDLIMVDAYMSNQVYGPCLDPAFPVILHTALEESGVAACNLISTYPLRGHVEQFIESAKNVFPYIYLLPVGMPIGEQNILAILCKNPITLEAWQRSMRSESDLNLAQRFLWPFRLRAVCYNGADAKL